MPCIKGEKDGGVSEAQARKQQSNMRTRDPSLSLASSRPTQGTRRQRVAPSSSLDSSDFSIGSITRENKNMEVGVEGAHVNMKEELADEEAREEA